MAMNYPELLINLSQSDVQNVLDLRYHLISNIRHNGCRVFFVRASTSTNIFSFETCKLF